MSEHTKEPWRYDYEPGYCGELIAANGTIIATFTDEPSEADARRIVACVNACAGIDTDHLEAVAFLSPHLPDGLKDKTIAYVDLLELIDQARKELVAFAEELKASSTLDGNWGEEWEAKEEYDRLMALAAKLAEKEQACL